MNKIRMVIIFLFMTLVLLQTGCVKEQDFLEDALDLISVIEDLEDISEKYKPGKQEFIDSIKENTSKDEFIFLVRKYLTLLQDGHTKVEGNTNKKFLDLDYYAVDDEMFLLEEDGSISEIQITEIGGVAIARVYNTVQTYFTAENETASHLNNNMWALNYEVLKLAGCDISKNSVDIIINENGLRSEDKIKFVKKDVYKSYKYSTEIESKVIDDIFYIDMNTCNNNKKLDTQVTKLKEAIENGITKIIIDVRDNPGGNSEACEKLLHAMDMSAPDYGIYIRYSDLVNMKYATIPSDGFEQVEPDKTTAKSNNKIDLVVLINEKTFSSATMMGVFVQDGSLGTLIGQPSSNAPSDYGDIAYYKLPNSKFKVSISHKKYLRPDIEADQKTLSPDIITEYNEDALMLAIDYLNEK